MKIGSFEFNLRELAASLGEFGTLLPLAIGYITICELNPAGLLVMMGLTNIATGLIYSLPMPMCHGAGGLAGQYFGARTGGTNIIEGTIEVAPGVLLAGSIAALFAALPMAIVGAMMLLVGIEMVRFACDLRFNRQLIPVAVTLAGSLLANMAVGFAVGIVTHYLLLGKEHRHADAQQ